MGQPELSIFDLPHHQLKKYLDTGAPVYLLVNPVEYHGPHLSLHNDHLLSLGLMRRFHQKLSLKYPQWPLLYAQDLEVGVDPASGPGTRATRYLTAKQLIETACQSLLQLGVKKVVAMTFHGSALHALAIEGGLKVLREVGVLATNPFNRVLEQMVDPQLDTQSYAPAFAHIEDSSLRQEMIKNLAYDFHGGFFETSMALALAPDSVSERYQELKPCPDFKPVPWMNKASKLLGTIGLSHFSEEMAFAARASGWPRLRPFPGYTGHPHLATQQAGEFFVQRILEAYEEDFELLMKGQQEGSRTVLSWVAKLTLEGRIEPPKAGPEDVHGYGLS